MIKNFQTDFVLDYFDKVWSDVLQLDQEDVNLSVDFFLNNMNSILGDHLPLKWINKYKFKFKSKPWITPAIQKPITIKNNLPKRFTRTKDSQTKKTKNRNGYLHFPKKSKSNYYNQYFRANMNNIKNTWKGIKFAITFKNLPSDIPKSLSSSGSTIKN